MGLVGPDVEYSVIGEGGERMVSGTVFRTLLPPELRKASNNHKQSSVAVSFVSLLIIFIQL